MLEEQGRAHFLTQRFDRHGRTCEAVRLHMATLLLGGPHGLQRSGALQLRRGLRADALAGPAQPRCRGVLLPQVLHVIARNCDDHTKNTSFLMDPQGEWHLSPAYDITFAYNPANIWLKQHQMSVRGKRSDITRDDLLAVAKEMNIKKADAIIDEVVAGVKKWKTFAKKAEMDVKQTEVIKGMLRTRI
ncbi:MAG: HipA domain-containing protein [Flavobacteriales bacterium]|nr:HipA domain-containing protein [Flavobacteriales bacterium]